MKKADWIEKIIALDKENEGLLGEVSHDELDTFTVGQLKALVQDMEKDIADDGKDAPAPDGEAEGGFASMCGSEFNPKKTGECHKDCQPDFPEAFLACSENYKTSTVGTQKQKKPSLGKTEWGHTNGKQGGLIDNFFFGGSVGTMEEICKFSGGKEGRCMHHMKHLVFDLGITILYNFKKETEEVDGKSVTKQVKQYWWADKDKRRKGDALVGKSAYPSK